MFSPASFKPASFQPVSFSGLGILAVPHWLIRARRRGRR